MTEGVRLPVDRHVFGLEAETLFHEAAGVEDVAAEALAGNHVFVRFHPVTRGDFPSTLLDTLADPGKHLGVVLLGERVRADLALGKAEVRVLIHELEHGVEHVVGHGDGFGPVPFPVHVGVAVSHAVDRVLFRDLCDGGHDGLGFAAGGLEVAFLRDVGPRDVVDGLVDQGFPLVTNTGSALKNQKRALFLIFEG